MVGRVLLRSRLLAGVIILAALQPGGAVASAPDPSSSTTTSSSASSTVPRSDGVPPVVPPPAAVTPPPPEPAPTGPPPTVPEKDDAPLDEPPAPEVQPPPPPEVPPPTTPEQATIQQVIDQRLVGARVALASAELRRAEVHGAALALSGRLEALRAREPETAAGAARAATSLAESRQRMRKWAITLYAGKSLAPLEFVLEAGELAELPRRVALAKGGAAAAQREMRMRQEALIEIEASARAATAEMVDLQRALDEALKQEAFLDREVAQRLEDVEALVAGQEVAVTAVAFPVAGPNRFTDSFGAPRMTGTRYSHSHQGVDIFAAPGTPVVAFERGVLARVGTDLLGGTKLWLVGQSGTRYYYAHLQGYAPDIADGLVVEAGQVLAYVGNTGNALTTPHHLHFEIRPEGGEAVNPTPLLRQVADATAALAAAVAPPPTAPAAAPSPAPPARPRG